MIPLIDSFLNKLTMYKVVLFGLFFLVFISLIYSFFGIIFYKPIDLLFSLAILYATCFGINVLITKFKKIPMNVESAGITALILFFIMSPLDGFADAWLYILAGLLAMISKYVFTIHKKHIFNPAAISLVMLGVVGLPVSFWWIGSSDLFPYVLIVGFLVLRKIRKLSMFLVFALFTLLAVGSVSVLNSKNLFDTLYFTILSYPLLFLGAFMLTEPLTTPPKKSMQLIYASIVGLLTGLPLSFGPISTTPELSLLIGNLFSYSVSFKKRLELSFSEIKILSPDIYEFSFTKPDNFSFVPGQYMEWTLGGVKPDIRGIRRYFTIASAPSEKVIKIGIRAGKDISAYKKRLINLKKGDKIIAGNLAGDFTIQKEKRKYVFVAGGIGITPFRSIVKNAIDKNHKLDAVLIYSCSSDKDFVYKEMFDYAKIIGLKTIYICSHPGNDYKGVVGRADSNLIKKEVIDYKERVFYLSGPNAMVHSIKISLMKMGILPTKIRIDYFSGY